MIASDMLWLIIIIIIIIIITAFSAFPMLQIFYF
jgi:hypothetical protein